MSRFLGPYLSHFNFCGTFCNESWLFEGILVCEAGCILESLNDMLSDKGLVMPLDLAAKGR